MFLFENCKYASQASPLVIYMILIPSQVHTAKLLHCKMQSTMAPQGVDERKFHQLGTL